MSRVKPNIGIPSFKKSRQTFENFVLEVIEDSFIFEYTPDVIELLEGNLFKLTLNNKNFIEDTLKVDVPQDYVKIFLLSVEQPQERYSVQQINNDIVITFNRDITRLPQDIVRTDFKIKGRLRQVQ
jgi:hypothetical protein